MPPSDPTGKIERLRKALIADPIYRRSVARWSKLQAWHWLLICLGVLGLAAVLFGVPLLIYLPCPPMRMPNYGWSTMALAAVLSLFAGQAALAGVLALGAALLGGSSASRDDATLKDDLLLLTPLRPGAIVLARLAAVIRVLLLPLGVVAAIRLALLITIQPGLMERLYTLTALMPSMIECPIIRAAPAAAFAGNETYHLLHATLWRLDVLHLKWIWPVWAVSYIMQPFLDSILYAALGIAVSSHPRVRAQVLLRPRAPVWALMMAVGMWAIGYIAERVAALSLSAAWLTSIGMDAQAVWTPPWDFGGGISPPGLLVSLWTVSLPVITWGFAESAPMFELLWLATLGLKIGLTLLLLKRAGTAQQASTA